MFSQLHLKRLEVPKILYDDSAESNAFPSFAVYGLGFTRRKASSSELPGAPGIRSDEKHLIGFNEEEERRATRRSDWGNE